jgi:S-adenosylmethionine:tRNA ribosyltransferase-isomerase
MHREQLVIRRENLLNLLDNPSVVAVGTTSMRTLESLYWYGIKLHEQGPQPFHISKTDPYQLKGKLTMQQSVEQVVAYMTKNNWHQITGYTELFIVPGYAFRVCRGLITNYHLPGTTLMMLVAAFIGKDWRKVYQEALDLEYRFLSYGDSSLLLP